MPRPSRLPHPLTLAPFRVAEAAALGVTPRRLRGRDLFTPVHGTRSLVASTDLESRCRAMELLMPSPRYFSHTTAALLWGIPLPARVQADERLHITHPGGRAPVRRGVVGHQVAQARAVTVHLGFPVSIPADAWCELATTTLPGGRPLSLDELIIAGDRLIGWKNPLSTVEQLDTALARFASSRGIRMLRRARREIRAGSASPRETRLRLLIARAHVAFPEPELNGRIVCSSGVVLHGDLVFRAHRVLVEYDGNQHRTDTRQFVRDVDRMNYLAVDGWQVIRVHASTPDASVLAWLESALRSRGWRP
ncbi:MAG TPA: DUF559 domain-containing protein [Candidatus Lumbricidophila sp.]|nr:DUF559 domain-containing protein [Candidatus Lumbricidophila sp.]